MKSEVKPNSTYPSIDQQLASLDLIHQILCAILFKGRNSVAYPIFIDLDSREFMVPSYVPDQMGVALASIIDSD